ncbi:hypothetical protein [Streptomyces orinoci]|uniref:Uncharacterized protein n=1 Tax=Streptomyces orinoci TaxID=67339 RepID=A0ABV3K0S8_STRON
MALLREEMGQVCVRVVHGMLSHCRRVAARIVEQVQALGPVVQDQG